MAVQYNLSINPGLDSACDAESHTIECDSAIFKLLCDLYWETH